MGLGIRRAVMYVCIGVVLSVACSWVAAAFSPLTRSEFRPAKLGECTDPWPRNWTVCRTFLERRGPAIRSRLLSECEWIASSLASSPLTAPNRTIIENATGWPWPALRWIEVQGASPSDRRAWWRSGVVLPKGPPIASWPERRLPIDPLVAGLFGDSVLLGTAAYGVIGLASLRRWSRRRAGRCERCGYDLSGSAGACPECGLTRPPPGPRPSSERRDPALPSPGPIPGASHVRSDTA